MDTNKLVYRDDMTPRQNMETLFNWVRFMMNEFKIGRVSYQSFEKIKKSEELLDNAICELDSANTKRYAAIENALCEQDGRENANG